ncbi:SPINDLE AND KINETOCHORE-ASSOCIATED PROTEIN 3 [Salix koriyanagi]|uniref:SPINDLE AND KINETOCHORE-ASSOCIATED PROTEIN 3 n=1 Tax=Salix koriyanagi TaxID=2511006 RepID=A0A9Q0X3I2_9ROSI|nr:SPINDLE AND KINETOCHORE-ASSOCIATED PROTEIN 3 [Salix koriyanagi]
MEETISEFSKSIGSFCNHLQSSCDALKQSIDRRPIPLDSASSTYIQCLNRRVASASSDLNLLESMAFGTVSFEELLGHCNEVYKSSENRILEFQDRLRSFGYVPAEVEIDDEADLSISMELGLNLKDEMDPSAAYNGPVSVASSIMKSLEEDPLMDESLSLKSLGLSDVCLATLAAEANSKINDPDISMRDTKMYYGDKLHNMKSLDQNTGNMELIEGELKPAEALRAVVKASKDDYESLPSYMKSLTSWEDLLAAVEKINSSLKMKDKTKGNNYFRQDEITSMDLGMYCRFAVIYTFYYRFITNIFYPSRF